MNRSGATHMALALLVSMMMQPFGERPAVARSTNDCAATLKAERAELRVLDHSYHNEIASIQRQLQLTKKPTPGVVDREYNEASLEVPRLRADVHFDSAMIDDYKRGGEAWRPPSFVQSQLKQYERKLSEDRQALATAQKRLDFWTAQKAKNELGVDIALPHDFVSSLQSRLAWLESQRQVNAHEIGYMTAMILACPTPKPASFRGGDWNGTYTAGGETVTLTQSSPTELTGESTWTEPGQTHETQGHDETFKTCKIEGSQAICSELTGKYWDPDKTIDYDGTVTLTLAGKVLTKSIEIKAATTPPAWKHGDKGYTSAVSKGAKFSATLTRQ